MCRRAATVLGLDPTNSQLTALRDFVSIDWHAIRRDPRGLLAPALAVVLGAAACLVVGVIVRADLRQGTWLVPGRLGLVPLEHFVPRSEVAIETGLFLSGFGILAWALLRWYRWRRNVVTLSAAFAVAGGVANALEAWSRGSVTDYVLLSGVGVADLGDILITAGLGLFLTMLHSPRQFDLNYRDVGLSFVAAGAVGLSFALSGRHDLSRIVLVAVGAGALTWVVLHTRCLLTGGYDVRHLLKSFSQGRPDDDPDRVVSDLERVLRNPRGRDHAAARYTLEALSWTYAGLRRPDDLRRSANELLQLAKQLGSAYDQAWALDYLGLADAMSGHFGRALRWWHQALDLTEDPPDDAHRMRLLRVTAMAEAMSGQRVRSRHTFRAAIDLARGTGQGEAAVRIQEEMTRVLSTPLPSSPPRSPGPVGPAAAAFVGHRGQVRRAMRRKRPRF
jgi:hypothetical protein